MKSLIPVVCLTWAGLAEGQAPPPLEPAKAAPATGVQQSAPPPPAEPTPPAPAVAPAEPAAAAPEPTPQAAATRKAASPAATEPAPGEESVELKPPVSEQPRELPYYEGEPAPAGYRLVERTRRGWIIAGALTFGIPYAISVSVAAGGRYEDPVGWLLLPIVGPWVAAGRLEDDVDCVDSSSDSSLDTCDDVATQRGLLAFDGLAQAAGAVMIVLGMTSPRQLWVLDSATELEVTPVRLGRSGYGVAATGTF